jgi:hypothetical protein
MVVRQFEIALCRQQSRIKEFRLCFRQELDHRLFLLTLCFATVLWLACLSAYDVVVCSVIRRKESQFSTS